MATVLIYNHVNNTVEKYTLDLTDPMPYTTPGVLQVGEFRGSSNSNIIWTDRRLMECFSILRRSWGQPILVPYAFKRIWEGGHSPQSQHYAGTAIDMGQNLTSEQRAQLRQLATDIGCFSYVEPAYLTPTWVHVDTRISPPACTAGYPVLRFGSRNTYVLVLQDALSTLGFGVTSLDGIFGNQTRAAVESFQRSQGISPTGVVACETWRAIATAATGAGATATTIQ